MVEGKIVEEEETGVFTIVPEDIGRVEQYSFLFYGASGVGKTLLAASFKAIGEVVFLSCDIGRYGGLLSARHLQPLQKRLYQYEDYLTILPTLEKTAGKGFKTLVLDSATSFQRLVMQSILFWSGKEIPRFEDWNLCVERIRTALNKLGSLPCHLIITATEQITRDEVLGKIFGLPNIPGKLAQELPAAVDVALHLYTRTSYTQQGKREVRYLFSTTPDEIWVGKDRTGTLPPEAPTSWDSLKHLLM